MTANLSSPATQGRWDIYGPIHKGIRMAHGRMLTRLGSADFTADQTGLLSELSTHLRLCAQHLKHEEAHIHTALEARAPGAAAMLEDQHDSHRRRFAEMEAAIAAVAGACPAERVAYGRSLYLLFSALVGEDMEHMAEEETTVWPRLCALFTDHELAGIEMTIIANCSPPDSMAYLQMMLPATTRAERASLLAGMKANAPAEAFAAVIEFAARPTLAPEDFAHLQDLGIAA